MPALLDVLRREAGKFNLQIDVASIGNIQDLVASVRAVETARERQSLLTTIAIVGGRELLPELADFFSDSDPQVREAALYAVGIACNGDLECLEKHLAQVEQHDDPSLRNLRTTLLDAARRGVDARDSATEANE